MSSAGFIVRPFLLTPFDQAAAAKVAHFDTYNRTAAGQRVADIVAAARANPGAALVADGDVALAAPSWRPSIAPLPDCRARRRPLRFVQRRCVCRTPVYSLGLRRAGDLRTAASIARGRLVSAHNAGDRFAVTGVELNPRMLTPVQIAETIRLAPAARARREVAARERLGVGPQAH